MKYFPINIDIRNRKALVVGGGNIAYRKVQSLLECGAQVTVVSPQFCTALSRIKKAKKLKRRYRKSDIRGACIVVSATDSYEVNRRVWQHATDAMIPVNVVDQPELCTFTVPATISRGELLITISTGGGSPALSARIRRELEAGLDPVFESHLKLLTEMRPKVLSSGLSEKKRGALLKTFAGESFHDLIRRRGAAAARKNMLSMLSNAAPA